MISGFVLAALMVFVWLVGWCLGVRSRRQHEKLQRHQHRLLKVHSALMGCAHEGKISWDDATFKFFRQELNKLIFGLTPSLKAIVSFLQASALMELAQDVERRAAVIRPLNPDVQEVVSLLYHEIASVLWSFSWFVRFFRTVDVIEDLLRMRRILSEPQPYAA
ncbi:hypothetical protein HYZ80_01740 [Candidatus Parcubacteria bacterium]|nr:hypothetical protein [Candidatus Parcubacteria bacterium]